MSAEFDTGAKVDSEQVRGGTPIFYTDADATLLNHTTYSYDLATPSLRRARRWGTPVVLVTSKTADEVIAMRERMIADDVYDPNNPAATENGAGLYFPSTVYSEEMIQAALGNLLKRDPAAADYRIFSDGGFNIVRLGPSIEDARNALAQAVRSANSSSQNPMGKLVVRTSQEMTPAEFAEETGLSLAAARKALHRNFLEIFHPNVPAGQEQQALDAITPFLDSQYVLNIGGRFCQIMGAHATKGNALRIMNGVMEQKFGKIWRVGLGDAKSDLPLMAECDQAFLIKNPKKPLTDAEIPSAILSRMTRIDQTAPLGWNTAVDSVFQNSAIRTHMYPRILAARSARHPA